jgi:hypothetical protein
VFYKLMLSLSLVFMITSSVCADEIDEYKDRLANYKVQGALLNQQKLARLFTREFTQLNRNFLKAETLLREEEEDSFKREVGLIALQIQFIEVSIHELEDKEKVQKVREQATSLDNKVKLIRQEIHKLETKLNQKASGAMKPSTQGQAPINARPTSSIPANPTNVPVQINPNPTQNLPQ